MLCAPVVPGVAGQVAVPVLVFTGWELHPAMVWRTSGALYMAICLISSGEVACARADAERRRSSPASKDPHHGHLAGGLPVYLRQFATWCRARSLHLSAVRRSRRRELDSDGGIRAEQV